MSGRAGEIVSGSSATTYVIDRPCDESDRHMEWADDGPCEVVRLDHYGMLTPHLFCNTHVRTVGHVL